MGELSNQTAIKISPRKNTIRFIPAMMHSLPFFTASLKMIGYCAENLLQKPDIVRLSPA